MTKIITVSGFLGAGKTTAIAELASHYISTGKKVAIITNDQGSDLVDTQFLRSRGFTTSEIFGGCFCCNFGEMKTTVMQLHKDLQPDIILAEAVGSCTDLYATVIKPLHANYPDLFETGPLVTMADPKRVTDVLGTSRRLFPHEVDYLFRKQLEEAQQLVLTKSDLYDETYLTNALELLQKAEITVPVSIISSKYQRGTAVLATNLYNSHYVEATVMDLDYKVYTLAEKHLGWFNMKIDLKAMFNMDFNLFAAEYMELIREDMASASSEIAHLKLFASAEDDYSKVSLTDNGTAIEFNHRMTERWTDYSIYINARINSSPEAIKQILLNHLNALGIKHDYTYETLNIEYFQPGDPDPNARTLNMAV